MENAREVAVKLFDSLEWRDCPEFRDSWVRIGDRLFTLWQGYTEQGELSDYYGLTMSSPRIEAPIIEPMLDEGSVIGIFAEYIESA
jgi:hypothetical protein